MPESSIREQIRLGACRHVGKIFWKNLQSSISDRDLAAKCGFDHTAIARGRKTGELSFPHFLMILVGMGKTPNEMIIVPPKEELAIHGYIMALTYVRHRELDKMPVLDLSVDDLKCLRLCLESKEYWGLSKVDRKQRAEEIVFHVGGTAVKKAKDIGSADVYLTFLRENWLDAWIMTRDAICGAMSWLENVKLEGEE